MIDMATRAVGAGQSAIVDAVFATPQERDGRRGGGRARAGVPFTGIWLEAPAAQLGARIAARRGDASDATVDVLQRQLAVRSGADRRGAGSMPRMRQTPTPGAWPAFSKPAEARQDRKRG